MPFTGHEYQLYIGYIWCIVTADLNFNHHLNKIKQYTRGPISIRNDNFKKEDVFAIKKHIFIAFHAG